MGIRYVRTSGRVEEDRVIFALEEQFDVVVLDRSSYADWVEPSKDTQQVFELFVHTPQPLVASWTAAQDLISTTQPGDVIAISDAGGIGGVLALTEAVKPREERREIWTIAGDGIGLESLLIDGSVDHAEMPEASQIDWEFVQYRYSAEVLAFSMFAVHGLSSLGFEAGLLEMTHEDDLSPPIAGRHAIWAPGAVSRRNRTGDVLRAVAGVAGSTICVSYQDTEDGVWLGSTWDALDGIRGVLGDRLTRSETAASTPSVVVVGETLGQPDPSAQYWKDRGVPVVVPRDSVAANLWPTAPVWSTSDELASVLEGGAAQRGSPRIVWVPTMTSRASISERATKVSVGVPIFRSVEFLDACIMSILGQTVPAHEVILVDDGSASTEVDTNLRRWAEKEPDLVSVIRQPNRGVCVARNRMVEHMTGDAFVLVDQDDVLAPEFIEATATAMRQREDTLAVAVWTEFFGEYEGIEAKPPFDRRVGMRENPIVSTAALVDISVAERGVEFSPDLAFIYCEDWNYWSQIVAVGGRITLVPRPLVRHRVHQSSGGFRRTEVGHAVGMARAVAPLRE